MSGPTVLDRLIRRGQAGLNRLHLAAWIMRGIASLGMAAGIVLLAARLLGQTWASVSVWAIFLIMGGLGGLVLGWRSRYDQARTAFWLDRQLHLEEALSAALVCLARECRGRFDQDVLARAERSAYARAKLNWPWRAMVRWSGAAAGVVLLFGLALAVARPFQFVPAGKGLLKPSAVWRTAARAGQARRTAAAITAEEIARAIFPNNSWLAQRLAQALSAGETDAIQYLLAQAQREMDAEMQAASTPEQRQRIQSEQKKRRQAASDLAGGDGDPGESNDGPGPTAADQPGEEEDGGSRGQAGQGGAKKKPGSGGSKQGKTGAGQGFNGEGDGVDDRGEASDGFSAGRGGQGGNQAGKGTGTKGSSTPVSAKPGGAKAPVEQGQSQFFEYVLPGTGTRVPLSQAAADGSRAAEGAIDRTGLPGEYADYIRLYFLLLSRAAGTSKGGQTK